MEFEDSGIRYDAFLLGLEHLFRTLMFTT